MPLHRTHKLLLASILVASLMPAKLIAHPAIDAQVAIVNERLEQEPHNASLYLRRGQLHQAHRAWHAAIADYERAAEIDASFHGARIRLSEALLEVGRAGDAKQALDSFLSEQPDHVDALVLRGRILSRLGMFAPAVTDYDRAIYHSARPQPDWFLERARAAAQLDGKLTAAILGLDEGLVRLGPLVTLQAMAVELELRRQNFGAALSRVEQMLSSAPRQPQWLVKRGELLVALDRHAEARASFAAALEVIESLPINRRSTKLVLDLEQQTKDSIGKIDSTIQFSNADKGVVR